MFRRSSHSAEYRKHLASPEWARIRRAALERACYRCSWCGRDRKQLALIGRHLQVHHSTYKNLGRERPEDLTVLCAGGRNACHAAADQQRRLATGKTRKPRTKRKRHRLPKAIRELRTIGLVLVLGVGGLKAAAILLPLVSS